MHNNRLMIELNGSNLDGYRLFCGDRLWLLFYVFRAVLMRSGLLISWSFKERSYKDWREDKGIEQLLESTLTRDELKKLQESRFGGLSSALARVEGMFLHEATRVMSGSKAMADSLADMQAIMLLQNAKIVQSGSGS